VVGKYNRYIEVESAVGFENLSCHFGEIRAVGNVSFEVKKGEFFAMLGPSGSGKSTCLRLIAGFQKPTSGRIKILGEDVALIPPYRRKVNIVFQDYALFPHMNVSENVAYGLLIKGVSKPDRVKAVDQALDMVRLSGYGRRKPNQLSGGQRQRVALARALVNKPEILLLDEPLGALDLKLREQMQEELKDLHRELGITFILVTHDQGEAMSMADRVAVFSEGKIAQLGTPENLYKYPQSPFIASFVGSSNVLSPEFVDFLTGRKRWASLRSEAISLVGATDESAQVTGTILSNIYLGSSYRITVDAQGQRLRVLIPAGCLLPVEGETVGLSWSGSDFHLMEDELT